MCFISTIFRKNSFEFYLQKSTPEFFLRSKKTGIYSIGFFPLGKLVEVVSFHEFPPSSGFSKALILGAAVAVRQSTGIRDFPWWKKHHVKQQNMVKMVKITLHNLEVLFLFVGMEVVKVRMRWWLSWVIFFVKILRNTNKPCKHRMRRRCLGTKTCQLLFVGVSWWFERYPCSEKSFWSFRLGDINLTGVESNMQIWRLFCLKERVVFSILLTGDRGKDKGALIRFPLIKQIKQEIIQRQSMRITPSMCFGVQWSSLPEYDFPRAHISFLFLLKVELIRMSDLL